MGLKGKFVRSVNYAAITLTSLLCSSADAAAERANPAIARLILTFETIRDDYALPIDAALLTDAAIAAIKKDSKIEGVEWLRCLESERMIAASMKLPTVLKPVVNALDCAGFGQKSAAEADAMVDNAVRGMVAKLDDQSRWLGPADLKSNIRTQASPPPAIFGSTGLSLTKRNDTLIVVRTGARTPSRLAGWQV